MCGWLPIIATFSLNGGGGGDIWAVETPLSLYKRLVCFESECYHQCGIDTEQRARKSETRNNLALQVLSLEWNLFQLG